MNNKKITSLTKEQEAKMHQYAANWIKIGRDTSTLNQQRCREVIADVYAAGGLKAPAEVVFQPSPIAAVKYLKERFPKMSGSDITAALIYGQTDAGWLSFYAFFDEQVGIKGTEQCRPLRELAKHAGWCYVFDTIAVICEKPVVLHINEANRLHCTNGPAIKYSNGDAIYALNGVTMPAWLFETPKEKLTGKQIMGITNVEQRGEAIKWYGLANMLELLSADVLDETGCQYGYQLLALDVGTGRKERYLRMLNPSTGEVHIEGVPPETTTCLEALKARWPSTLLTKYGFKQAVARA